MTRHVWFRRLAFAISALLIVLLVLGPIAASAATTDPPAQPADPYPQLEDAQRRLALVQAQAEDLEAGLEAARASHEDALAAHDEAVDARTEAETGLEEAEETVDRRRAALRRALRDDAATPALRASVRRAVQDRRSAQEELDEARDEVTTRTQALQVADDLLQLHEAMVAHNMVSIGELEAQVADWDAYIDGLRNVQPRAEAPADLVGYGNGRIPREALEPIGVGAHRLWGPAAEAYKALVAAAAADGVEIGITDSYRTYEVQVDLVLRKGLYSEGGLAARPGTSKHGWGLAVDLILDDEALAWMRANAADYGWVETTPREPWHWEFTARATD